MSDLTLADVEEMPTGTTFGRVTGNISMFVGDSPADSDTLPERLPLGGKITFTPNVAYVIHEPTGDLIFQTTIEADVQSDGSFVIDLVATDNPDLNPKRWAYTVKIQAANQAPLTARIPVPGGSTQTLGKLMGAVQPGVAVAQVAPTVTWDGTTMIVNGQRGPDLSTILAANDGLTYTDGFYLPTATS